jgi:hypothetical protein
VDTTPQPGKTLAIIARRKNKSTLFI